MLGRGGNSLPCLLWGMSHLPWGRLQPLAVFILFPPKYLSTQAFYQGPIWWPTPLVSTGPVGAQLHLQEVALIWAKALPGQ